MLYISCLQFIINIRYCEQSLIPEVYRMKPTNIHPTSADHMAVCSVQIITLRQNQRQFTIKAKEDRIDFWSVEVNTQHTALHFTSFLLRSSLFLAFKNLCTVFVCTFLQLVLDFIATCCSFKQQYVFTKKVTKVSVIKVLFAVGWLFKGAKGVKRKLQTLLQLIYC